MGTRGDKNMGNNLNIVEECNRVFNFWKLEEYFTPQEYPKLTDVKKENEKEVPFDTFSNKYGEQPLPLENYKSHNMYLSENNKSSDMFYNRANVYCGCYKVREFIYKMAEQCGLDTEKYPEIGEIKGRFYIFSVQIDLEGNLTEEGVQISPFFYAVICMMQSDGINAHIMQGDIVELGKDINEILKQNNFKMSEFADTNKIKSILFDKLRIVSDQDVGLVGATDNIFACKALRANEETSDFGSFYLDDIEYVHKHCTENKHVMRYVLALMENNSGKVNIDGEVKAMHQWLNVDKYPLAKYPSKFSPTLMQQIAINIAISEQDRNEKIFSVNGPPGTGKTTLLKEIIASNVEKMAEVLIQYGVDNKNFEACNIISTSTPSYTDKYYKIPDEIAKYGILVVSNNNGAVENITLDLPKADDLKSKNTWTDKFDRSMQGEIYFSKVADQLMKDENASWGLISARMGRKAYVSKVLDSCIFAKSNDAPDKVTLDCAKDESISWNEAVAQYKQAKARVLSFREEIKRDKKFLIELYQKEENLNKQKVKLANLETKKTQSEEQLKAIKTQLEKNESDTAFLEDEIKYIKAHVSWLEKIKIFFGWGENGKRVLDKKSQIHALIIEHEEIKRNLNIANDNIKKVDTDIQKQISSIVSLENSLLSHREKIYGDKNSLKSKYQQNLADRKFYTNIKASEESQNACPWTFAEYDKAREELFYASLQVRKAFILESPYIRRNLFVYAGYNSGKYTLSEKMEMFPHLFNALAVVIPVVSSTFASVGRFLKHAGNQSLGMLVIDESGQAVPQSAVGALYRTRSAVVVGDPLQIEPVVTIPQALIDIFADSTGIAKEYKSMENSAQIFADQINEFNGRIGERVVGCPLVVHRRCIEPMFSISNMISYDNRMFNKTNKKEEYLDENQPFVLKKSGWIHVEGQEKVEEKGVKNHFVENQAIKVCKLLEIGVQIYEGFFETDDKIFIITPFRLVAVEMRSYIKEYFKKQGFKEEVLTAWTNNCVGTVHTFQGKDANEVFFVLGCSAQSGGAINWVVKKANILNVACTRAKYRFAFVGNYDDWKGKQYFSDVIPRLVEKVEG